MDRDHGISVRELISTLKKKKKAQEGNEFSNILPKFSHARKKPPREDLDSLYDWCEDFQFLFHFQMCNKALKVKLSQKKSEAQYTVKASEGSGHQLTESAAEKDLGMLIDKQLSFKDHVANITSKAN